MDMLMEYFGEPIDVYSDADALEDGVVLDISAYGLSFQDLPINRMTDGLWNDLLPYYPAAGDPNAMDIPAFCQAIRTKLPFATGSDRLWTLPPKIYLGLNDAGGWTLLRPEDY